MSTEKARDITKLAAQVNESFYAEVKVARLQVDLQKKVSELGVLPIGEQAGK